MKVGKLARLRNGLGRDARVIAISAAVASLITATPAVAAFVANSDKVDGKHAVSSNASIEARAGKLVATDKKGRLPNNVLTKAPNANKLDGFDSSELRVPVDGGTAETNATVQGCGETEVFSYPLEVSQRAYVYATAWSGLHSTSDQLNPSMRVELLDGAKVLARSPYDAWSGRDGDDMDVSEVLFGEKTETPYVAEPGSYTLRIHGRVMGTCDSSKLVQYQWSQLSHLLLPATQ